MHRRLSRTYGIGALLLCSQLLAAPGRAQERSPAATRAAEVVALINSGDQAAARKYVEEKYSPSFRGFAPMERHLGVFSMMHSQTRGLTVERVTEQEPGKATVLARSELTDSWFEIAFEVDAKPPHLIDGFRFRPATAPPERTAPLPRTDAERARDLDAYVRRIAAADAFSGVVLLAKDGKPVFSSAYGDADKDARRANSLETAFNLASVNKMITAVAVAQLVEAGKLTFDDPLSKFLPGFPNPRAAGEIRIMHLLSHTAGLGSYLGGGIRGSRAGTVDEMMRFAADAGTAFAPGTRWRYSNTGFLVLGRVIEKVSGKSYFDYVRDHVYRPAGMTGTEAHPKDRIPATAAIGYDRRGTGYTSHVSGLPFRGGPAGGGYATAGDLLRFAEALRTGKLVSPAMVRVLTTPKPQLSSPEYGYGFSVDAGRGIAGHSGGFAGTSNNVDIFLGSGYTAVVLSNYGMSGRPIVERIRAMVGAQPAP